MSPMLREHIAGLWALLGETAGMNPNLLHPPTNMAQMRMRTVSRRRRKPRKTGRHRVSRPHTNRKRPLTVQQRAVQKVQQARRRKDVAGMRYWNLKYAKHR